jgi:hypothetical protein
MGISAGPNSISDNLAFHIDPANPRSYAGVGTVIYDLSGNGKTSYFTNGAFYQNYQKGVVVVDGNNDYISTPLFNLTSPITVSAWVKNVVDDSPVFSASGPEVSYGNNEVIHYFSGKSILVAGNPTVGKYFQFPQLNLNQWSNLVMTRDASNNMSIYLNGMGSTSNTQSYSNILQMNQIGRYSAFTNVYNVKGSIGEVKIYNRALSASEVLQNYNASKKRYLPEENIIKNGLVLNIDSANYLSYVGTLNTAYDLSGFGNTATLVNGTGFTGTNGGAFLFDGTNDYIGVNNNSSLQPTNLTLEIWFKLNVVLASQPTGFPLLLDKYSLSSFTGYRILFEKSADELQFTVFDSVQDNKAAITGAGAKLSQNWNCVQGTFDGNTTKIYLNGVLQQTFTRTFSISYNNEDLYLGTYYAVSDGFQHYINAYLGNVRIYNRALSATEIQQNFNAMRERYNL